MLTSLYEDPTRTEVDVLVEINITLQLLRLIVDQLSLKEQLAGEQLAEQGKNNEHRHDPLGNVLILSNSSLPLSSAIIPLSYSIAAGNNSILILPAALPVSSKKLYQTLQSSGLDLEATGLLAPTTESELEQNLSELSNNIFHGVFTQGEAETRLVASQPFQKLNPRVRLTFAGASLNAAVVTRKADVKLAANEIVRAFCGYGATTSSAPGIVLVDEFVAGDFVDFLIRSVRETQMRLQRSDKPKPGRDIDSARSFIVGFKRQGGRAIELGDGKVLLVGNPDWK